MRKGESRGHTREEDEGDLPFPRPLAPPQALQDQLVNLPYEHREAVIAEVTRSTQVPPSAATAEIMDRLLSQMTPQQILKLETLRSVSRSMKQTYEQLDLARVSKLLNQVAKNNQAEVRARELQPGKKGLVTGGSTGKEVGRGMCFQASMCSSHARLHRLATRR